MATDDPVTFEYDQRQYRLMLERLCAFENTKVDFFQLVDDLKGLLNALEDPDDNWKKRFRGIWIHLETERAVALDERAQSFAPGAIERIREAILGLKALVDEKLIGTLN